MSVIHGSQLVGTITVGAMPEGIVYDPSNGFVYVANLVSDTVSVIQDLTVLATVPVGPSPQCEVVVPRTGDVYVCDSTGSNLTVINGESVIASVPTGSGPSGATFDPRNGDLYVTNLNSLTLTVVNRTSAVGTIVVENGPEGPGCDPVDGIVYVPEFGANNVSLVSTVFGESLLSLVPPGHPAQSADVGESVSFQSTLWSIGSGNDTASWSAHPSAGITCGPNVSLTRSMGEVALALACRPTAPGNYTVWVNASDSERGTQWAFEVLTVFDDPSAGPVQAQLGANPEARSADVGQTFRLLVEPSGGSGTYASFAWSGLPPGDCSLILSDSPACAVSTPDDLQIGVTVTDSNGESSVGASLAFDVLALPVASETVPSRGSADVGQPVTFTTNASSGSGGYQDSWFGLPAGGAWTSRAPM